MANRGVIKLIHFPHSLRKRVHTEAGHSYFYRFGMQRQATQKELHSDQERKVHVRVYIPTWLCAPISPNIDLST